MTKRCGKINQTPKDLERKKGKIDVKQPIAR